MRIILTALLATVMLFSCSKKDVLAPEAKPQQIILKSQNISIVNVNAIQSGSNQVTFNFATEYEKNLKSIELLSGASESLFCQMYVDFKSDNSLQVRQYSILDNDPKWNTTYYMIKYTTNDGNWFCSPVYKVVLSK
jgi:hypothetical protein